MWFKLAGADFSKNNLGTMSSISSSYLIDYTGLTGMSGSPSSVSYAGSSAGTSKTASVVVTVTSGYTFKQGSKITASGGKSGTVFTADKDYTGGQTFTFSMAITANTKLSGTAEATGGSSGGNTGGDSGENGGSEPETPVNPPASGGTSNLLTLGTLHENTVTESTTSAVLKTDSNYFTYEKVPVSPSTKYVSVGGRRLFELDSSGAILGVSVNINNNTPIGSFTTSSKCAYVTISYKYADLQPSEATLTTA